MKIVIKVDRKRLHIYEFVKDMPKTYKVKPIENLKWANRGWNRVVNKEDCIYYGELTKNISELVETWNSEEENRNNAFDLANENFHTRTEIIKKEIIKNSL